MHSLYLRENNGLLVDRVLGMDSLSFREDVAAVAPDFLSSVHLKNSPPHNSLDSTDSNKSSARVQDDTDGLVFARASNGCLWLCKSYFLILSLLLEFVTLEATTLYWIVLTCMRLGWIFQCNIFESWDCPSFFSGGFITAIVGKTTGKETGKTHLCAVQSYIKLFFLWLILFQNDSLFSS